MRSSPSYFNKRSRPRNGPRRPQRNTSLESNGPDVKLRGNCSQLVEKYGILARDAHGAGNRIIAESMFQHAEHYQRLINAQAETRGSEVTNRTNGGGRSQTADNGGETGVMDAKDGESSKNLESAKVTSNGTA